jgi:hypothetical protein
MPISPLLDKASPEEAERLGQAFNFTLKALNLVDRNDPVCEIVARKVIEIDKAGTHDPREIATIVVKTFGIA